MWSILKKRSTLRPFRFSAFFVILGAKNLKKLRNPHRTTYVELSMGRRTFDGRTTVLYSSQCSPKFWHQWTLAQLRIFFTSNISRRCGRPFSRLADFSSSNLHFPIFYERQQFYLTYIRWLQFVNHEGYINS